MLAKSKTGQVLKKIKLNSSFSASADGKFYIPIEMSKNSSSFFNVKKILVTFTPVSFTNTVKKPYHIKNNSDNKKSYKINDVVDEKNSNIYKSIYAKNIVNSKDQVSFKGNIFNVNIPAADVDMFEVVTSTDLQDIVDATIITSGKFKPGTDQITNIKEEFNDFFIRVYALNEKNEVVDNIETRSRNIQNYIESESELSQKIKLNVLSSRLNEVLDGFRLRLSKFSFSSSSSNENIVFVEDTGTEIMVNEQAIQEIVNSEESGGLLVNLSFYLVDNLDTPRPSELKLISVDTSRISDFLEEDISLISILKRNFKLNCLKNQDYKDVITKLYNRSINENLSKIKVYYKVVLSASSTLFNSIKIEDMTLIKEESFSKENLTQAFEDIQRFNFSNDIKDKKVFVLSILKDNNNESSFLNKLTLSFNNSLHKKQKVFKNAISFDFVVYDDTETTGQRNVSVEEFYFDKSLSEENSVLINSNNKIESYNDSNNINLYFNLDNIKEVFVNFYNTLQPSTSASPNVIRVGPFKAEGEIITSEFRQSISSFRFLENKMKEKIQIVSQKNTTNVDDLLTLISGESIDQTFEFMLKDFINDNLPSIQKLDFFPDMILNTLVNPLSSVDSRREVLGSILVKIEKTLSVNNNMTLFSIQHYCFLSDIPSISTDSKTDYNIKNQSKTANLVNLNILDVEATIKRDLLFVKERNFNGLSRDFNCSFRTTLEPILLSQKVTKCLGSPKNKSSEEINESKSKIVEIISNLNPNYSTSELTDVFNLGYKKTFNSNREDFVRKVFGITNLSNSQGKILQEISITKEDLL